MVLGVSVVIGIWTIKERLRGKIVKDLNFDDICVDCFCV